VTGAGADTLRSAVLALITFLALDVPGLDSAGPDRLHHLLDLYYVAFAAGAVISIAGYGIPSKTMQILGIALIFISTAIFVAAIGSYG
jgi:Kef-type K+ transport system membrane component KefB